VLSLEELCSFVHELHAVAQHTVDQTASLAAISLIAIGVPSLVRSRRNCAPRYVLLSRKVLAAILKALAARLLVGSRPLPMILSPLILLSGHRRSQETKWCSVFHLLISHPTSLRIVIAVITSTPSIWVRSAPVKQVTSLADAAFAKPEIYEALEKCGVMYAIRIPAIDSLEGDMAELLTRPVGRPSHKTMVRY
jgi:hypothetical protein